MEILWQILRYLHDHNEQVIGGTIVLFLLSTMFFLMRTFDEKPDRPVEAKIDIDSIEGVMRKVLETQPVLATAGGATPQPAGASDAGAPPISASTETVTAPSAPASPGSPAELVALKTELEAKEKKIVALNKDLETAKKSSGGAAAGGGDDSALKKQLEELQARLAEYEIIEDDIADLSLYKEENAKLKLEIEDLKTKGVTATGTTMVAAGVAAAATLSATQTEPIAPSLVAATSVPPEPVLAATPEPVSAPAVAPPSTPTELTPEEKAMREFAEAIQVGKAPPTEAASLPPEVSASPTPPPAMEQPPPVMPSLESLLDSVKTNPEVTSQAEVDKIMAQTAEENASVPLAPAPNSKLDQIQAEAADLLASTSEAPTEALLEEQLNTDKLLTEVAALPKPSEGNQDFDDLLAEFNTTPE